MSCPHESALLEYVADTAKGERRVAIETHLESCDTCRAMLLALSPQRQTQAFNTTAPDTAPRSDAPLEQGTKVGRFVVLEHLGSGGMGVVYAAHDPELDRKVALKLLRAARPAADAEASRGRLLREAQAMARLADPNVVHIYEVGVWNERVFIAMELVDGETLGRWLRRREGDWRKALALFVAAGRG